MSQSSSWHRYLRNALFHLPEGATKWFLSPIKKLWKTLIDKRLGENYFNPFLLAFHLVLCLFREVREGCLLRESIVLSCRLRLCPQRPVHHVCLVRTAPLQQRMPASLTHSAPSQESLISYHIAINLGPLFLPLTPLPPHSLISLISCEFPPHYVPQPANILLLPLPILSLLPLSLPSSLLSFPSSIPPSPRASLPFCFPPSLILSPYLVGSPIATAWCAHSHARTHFWH